MKHRVSLVVEACISMFDLFAVHSFLLEKGWAGQAEKLEPFRFHLPLHRGVDEWVTSAGLGVCGTMAGDRSGGTWTLRSLAR